MLTFIRVHFLNGQTADGKVEEITDEQLLAAKVAMTELVREDNWQCNIERRDGSWLLCPGRNVMAIEFVKVDEEE